MTELLVFLLLCGVVYQWLHGRQSRDVVEDLKARVATLEERTTELNASLTRLRTVAAAPATPSASPVAPAPAIEKPTPAPPPVRVPVVERPVAPASAAPAVTPPPRPIVPAATETPARPAVPARPAADAPRVGPPITASPAPAAAAEQPDSLESRIGGRWALYFGVAFIVIAASVFVKYAVDHEWVTPAMRVVAGGLAGLVLIGAGTWFVRAGYGFYGQILTGGGVAVLYVCTYAAFNFYHLIGQGLAFALMAAITGAASVLADRQQSQGLALMAVGGGFTTPFLVSTGSGSETALFGYDAILVAGTMYLAHRREWPALNLVSCLLTTATFVGWAFTSWTPSARWTTQFFLTLFAAMFLYILRESGRQPNAVARLVNLVLGGAVLLAHAGSLANLWEVPTTLIVYLLAVSLAGLVAIGFEHPLPSSGTAGLDEIHKHPARPAAIGSATQRLVLWLAVILPFAGMADDSVQRLGVVVLGASLAALYGLHLAMQLREILARAPLSGSEIALIHAGGLLSVGAAYGFIADVSLDAVPLASLALAIVAGGAAALLWTARLDAALHFCVLAASLVAMAVAQHFDGAFVIAAWTTEGAGLLWLGLRTERAWVRAAGSAMFMLGLVQLLGLLSSPATVGHRVVFNTRVVTALYVTGMLVALSRLHDRLDRTPFCENFASFFLLAANLVGLTAATSEINAYFAARGEGLDNRLALDLAKSMSTIVAWMSIGTSIVWTGLRRRASWLRGAGAFVIFGAYGALLAMLLRAAPPLPIDVEGYTVVANARVVATLFVLAMLWHLLRLHRRAAADVPGGAHIEIDAITIAAHAAALLATISEIQMFWGAVLHRSLAAQSSAAMQTVAMALAAGSLIYIALRRSRDVVIALGGILLVVSLIATSALLLEAAPEGYRVLFNLRTLSALLHVALLYGFASLRRTHETRITAQVFGTVVIVASILTWLWLTSEIIAFWHLRDAGRTGYLGGQMTLSIVWAAYALVLIAVGMWRDYAPIRYFAIGLLGIAVVKVFFVDLAELDQIYKILTAVGLGILLIVTSFLYQKKRRDAAV